MGSVALGSHLRPPIGDSLSNPGHASTTSATNITPRPYCMKSGLSNQARNPDPNLAWRLFRGADAVVHKGDRADRLWGSHAPKHQEGHSVLPIRGEIENMKTNYPSGSTDLSRERGLERHPWNR